MVGGENAERFNFARAYKFTDALWKEKGFADVEDRAGFVAKLDEAISSIDKPVKI